jgi:hypothetical protein
MSSRPSSGVPGTRVRPVLAMIAVVALFGAPQLSGPPDWIEIGDRTYAREERAFEPRGVSLGEEIARVQLPARPSGTCSLAPTDRYYRLKVGTPIHRVVGHDPRTLVAIASDGDFGPRVYGVFRAPDARRGADLLDLSMGVRRIVVDEGRRTDLLTILDPQVLERIASAIATAPVYDAKRVVEMSGSEEHWVTFETLDGVRLERWLNEVYLHPGMVPPPELLAAVDEALRTSTGVPSRP